MRDFLRSKLFIFTVVMLVLSAALLIMSELRDGYASPTSSAAEIIVMPIQYAVTNVTDFFHGICQYFYDFDRIRDENAQLKLKIYELEKSLREADAAIAQNQDLRQLLSISQNHPDFSLEAAEVIGVTSEGFRSCYTIDKGENNGISLHDCVITPAGIVGYVSEVGFSSSKVSTLIDPESKFGAIISRSREAVVAEGSFSLAEDGLLKLSFLTKSSDIKVGDWVETSGLGQLFPKGLAIGTVEYISAEPDGMSYYAAVRPSADLSSLRGVFIITDFESGS